jgi:hypothetical protein
MRNKKLIFIATIIFLTITFSPKAFALPKIDTEETLTENLVSAKPESGPTQDYRQKIEQLVTEEAPEEEAPFEFDSYYRYMPAEKVSAMSGRIGITEAAQETSYVVKAFGKLPIELSVENSYIGIDNSTRIELPAKLTGLSFGVEATVPFFSFEKTYFRFGVFPSFYTDDWNFESSAFRMPNRYMVIHQPNDRLTLVAGIAVFPDFTEEVAPILGFIYKPNDRLTFNIIPMRPTVSYKLNEKLTVFGEGGSSAGEYEVTQDERKNVILEYKELHLGAGCQYNFNKNIQSSFTVGGIFNRQLRYHPDSLGKVNIDSGFYSEFRFQLKL